MEPKIYKHNNTGTPAISPVLLSDNVDYNLQLNLKQLKSLIDRTDFIHKIEQQPKFFPVIFLVSKYLRSPECSIPSNKDLQTVRTSRIGTIGGSKA